MCLCGESSIRLPKRGRLKYQRNGEDGQVAQCMDGDGDHEAAADLIGYSKENTPQQTGDGDSRINGVAQYKDQGAEDKSHNHTPSSQKAIEYSPKEELLCYRP